MSLGLPAKLVVATDHAASGIEFTLPEASTGPEVEMATWRCIPSHRAPPLIGTPVGHAIVKLKAPASVPYVRVSGA
jgi:hypothetical protein